MLLGMGHPNPVGILAHHPEAGEQLDSGETFFQLSLLQWVCQTITGLNPTVSVRLLLLCHPAVSRKQQPFQQGLQNPAGTAVFQVSSQHPYAEEFIGKPHVWTVDYNNSEEFEAAIKTIMRTQVQLRAVWG